MWAVMPGSPLLLKTLLIIVELHPRLLCLWRLPLCRRATSSCCIVCVRLLHSSLCRRLLPGKPGCHLRRQLCPNFGHDSRALLDPSVPPSVALLLRPLWRASNCLLRLSAALLSIPLPRVALLLLLLSRIGGIYGVSVVPGAVSFRCDQG